MIKEKKIMRELLTKEINKVNKKIAKIEERDNRNISKILEEQSKLIKIFNTTKNMIEKDETAQLLMQSSKKIEKFRKNNTVKKMKKRDDELQELYNTLTVYRNKLFYEK